MERLCNCGQCPQCMQNTPSNSLPGFGGNLPSAAPQFVPITFDTEERFKDFIREIIRKVGNHYELKSHSGKTLGRGTKGEMETREREVNYFKHRNQ